MGKARVTALQLRYRPVEATLTGDRPWTLSTFPPGDRVTLRGLRRGVSYEGQARNLGEGQTFSSWADVTFVIDDTTRTGTAALPPGGTANVAAAWISGGAITYTAVAGAGAGPDPGTATISVAAGTLRVTGVDVSYGAASATVNATNGSTVVYHLYYQDFRLIGGSQTLYATPNYSDLINSSANVYIGALSVVYPATGAPDGGGGTEPKCVWIGAWVLRLNDGRVEPIQAGDVRVGDKLVLANGRTGRVSHSARTTAACVRVGFDGGTLTCSRTAPLGVFDGGQVLAPDALGSLLDGRDGPVVCTDVADVGPTAIQHITCENDFFLAGDSLDAMISHHNMKPI